MNNKYIKIFEKHGLRFARCLGSKSGYREQHPDHLVVFNTRIYLKSYYEKEKDTTIRDFFEGQSEEVWYGDVNFNLDIYKLYKIQHEIEEPIVVCSEMGNKVVEIGEYIERNWVGTSGNKGITLKDIREMGD